MEVDELSGCSGGAGGSGDPENQLVNMFSSMATEDKDKLVVALQGVVGSGISPASCRFFLELANWNLSAAIGAYYDFDFSQQQQQLDLTASPGSQSLDQLPRLAILSCETEPLGEETVAITCTVYNESTGDCPPDCSLVCASATPAIAAATPLCEPCRLPTLLAGGNCRCRLLLRRGDGAEPLAPAVRLQLLAPDGTPLTSAAAVHCLSLQPGEAYDDSAAAAAAAHWAICEPPLTENPPPSPCQNEEQMME